ncbi:MAG TPA: hypothetical protein VFM94_05315, partial [Solirubrobacterales bacterium]|nr:hypothetical protein [Solirubrobacterales bacterium]
RVQQFREIADGEGHRFVRAFGLDVGGAGVNVCTVAASCQAGTASAAAGGMSEPKGIAVDQATGNIYVSDDGNHRIDVFGADGTFQGAFGWNVNATTPLESLQLCSIATGCQAGSTGGGAGQFGLPGGSAEPRGIGYPAISPSGAPNAGNLIVADTANNRIAEFEPTLNLGGEVTGIAFKRGIGWNVDATTPQEKMQTCTTATGCQTGSFGGALGQFTNFGLTRVAVDGTGAMYAVNLPNIFFPCNNTDIHCHVQKIELAATSAVEFAPAQLNHTAVVVGRVAATDIAVDPVAGEVYVATPNGVGQPAEYILHRFDLTGKLLDTQAIGVRQEKVFGLALAFNSGRIYFTSSEGGQRVHLLTNPPPIAPGVTTGETDVGADFALRTLEGAVNPEGFRVLGCFFEYGPTTAYGTTTPCVPAPVGIGEGTGDVEVSAETEPLEPNTPYHYRLVAENGGPVGEGEDRTFTTDPAPPDGCPNKERRAEQGIAALLLPDCMALEMVSPPKKSGQPAKGPNVSADGSRVSFVSAAVLGGGPGIVGLGGNAYVASRGASNWGVESTIPEAGIVKLWESENRPSFTPDFSHWLQIGATYAQLQLGIGQAFDAGLGGQLDPLSDPLVPLSSIDRNVVRNASLQGASADHTHLYFRPGPPSAPASYLPGDPQLSGPGAEAGNTYLLHTEAGAPQPLELLERDRDGKVWGGNCGARLGGIGPVQQKTAPARNGERNQGAISADGTRTYLSSRVTQPPTGPCEEASKLRILERLETATGPTIS